MSELGETFILSEGPRAQVWEAMPEMRWLARYGHMPGAPSVLQQAWRCRVTDDRGVTVDIKFEWRDVPTVNFGKHLRNCDDTR